jgi:hypothetical protein
LQKECRKLTTEIEKLRSQVKSMGSETDQRTEISELRFDKEALESKLRKFAAHCQRLEDDKAGMADALRSCNVDIEAYGSDISEAIIHLCDRLTSVEEAHSKSKLNEGGAREDLLENEKRDLRQKLEQVVQSEKRLAEQLKISTREAEEMKKCIETQKLGATTVSTEMRNKLRYLEQENLQLMFDMKATKKQLHAAREELEFIRMNGFDQNPTTNFGNIELQAGYARAGGVSSVPEGDTEPSDTIELTDLAKAYAESKAPALKTSSESKKRTILSDNTNKRAGTKSTILQTDKRQRHAAPESTLKVARKRSKVATTPGLGESSSLDSDSTGDCKQS